MGHHDYLCEASSVNIELEPHIPENFEIAKKSIVDRLRRRDAKHLFAAFLFFNLTVWAFIAKANNPLFIVVPACAFVFSLGRIYSIDMERNKANEFFRPINRSDLKKHSAFYLNEVVKNPNTRNYIEAVRHQGRHLYVCELNALVDYCLENNQKEYSQQDIENILILRDN
ncbi:hypothetical protein [Aeromonas sp. MrichA-1]|uniref:hypothetical protein n=1 Tax=Aeromonas sp. MrichA-1 TaxID=2823362 RepID=UPI001B3304E8|nr:hypothetical protein [Aeromonas sp. MrichA-1]MBP4081766.1 hypothetical protein [Aeromonas sp. MrichA-1]